MRSKKNPGSRFEYSFNICTRNLFVLYLRLVNMLPYVEEPVVSRIRSKLLN